MTALFEVQKSRICGSAPVKDILKTKASQMRRIRKYLFTPPLKKTKIKPPHSIRKNQPKQTNQTGKKIKNLLKKNPQNSMPSNKITKISQNSNNKAAHPKIKQNTKILSGSERWKEDSTVVSSTLWIIDGEPSSQSSVCVWKIQYNLFHRHTLLDGFFPAKTIIERLNFACQWPFHPFPPLDSYFSEAIISFMPTSNAHESLDHNKTD